MCLSPTAGADPEAHMVHVSTELPWSPGAETIPMTEWLETGWASQADTLGWNLCVRPGMRPENKTPCACDKWHRPHMSAPRTHFYRPRRDLLSALMLSPLSSGFLKREWESGQTAGEGRSDMLLLCPSVSPRLRGQRHGRRVSWSVPAFLSGILMFFAALIHATMFQSRWWQQIFGIDWRNGVRWKRI